MRYIYLFLLTTLSLQQSMGQLNFNIAMHYSCQITNPILTEINNNYYTSYSIFNLVSSGASSLYRYKANGQSYPIPFLNQYSLIKQSFKSLDNKLIILNDASVMCDVVDTSKVRSYLTKLDTNGTVIFNYKVKRPYNNSNPDHFKSALQYSDSSYFAFTDSVMYRISKSGTFISKKNLNISSIKSCLALANGNILLSAKSGIWNLLIEINTSGNIITQYQAPLCHKLLTYGNNNILGLSNTLIKFSSSYATIVTSTISAKDVVIKNDTIYSISEENNTTNYRVMDTSFNQIHSSVNTTSNYKPVSLIYDNGKITFNGIVYAGALGAPQGSSYSSICNSPRFSNINFTNDIAVTKTILDSSYLTLSVFGSGTLQTNTYYLYSRVKAWVVNKGPFPINSLKLNSFNNINTLCGYLYYQKSYNNLNVLPNDSILLTTDFILSRYFNTGSTLPVVSSSLCVYATVPNDQTDKLGTNDGYCNTFSYNVPVGINEKQIEDLTVTIFPNPFNLALKIEAIKPIHFIEISDVLGKVVYSKKTNSSVVNLDDFNGNNGVYFLKLNFENTTMIKKVVKQ